MIRQRKDLVAMKDRMRKRRSLNSSPSFSLSSFFVLLLCCVLFFTIVASTFRIFGVSFRPVLISTWQSPSMNVISTVHTFSLQSLPSSPLIQIQEAISFPDLVLIFVKPALTTNSNSNLLCLYYPHSSSTPNLELPSISSSTRNSLFVRCPSASHSFLVSLSLSPSSSLPPVQPLKWDHLAYTSVLDHQDNTTVVFAKGLNLRPARLSDPTRYECVFGWHLGNPKYQLTTGAISAAQEIFRCETPLSVLGRPMSDDPPLVSVKTKGRGSITLPTIARPQIMTKPRRRKKFNMCVCTMVLNQARFLREWIIYHSRVGVERWFIYDNNSDDGIEEVVSSMRSVSLHEWPWIKTQEAGFSHCALRARDSCEWVGFIDADEFIYLPSNVTLNDVLRNYSSQPRIGELRTTCHSFGPSGKKKIPSKGVMVGYTCRVVAPERHKSIVRPEALNPSLINIVHHFHLRQGMRYVNLETKIMVINHYKYQVWEVFKEKFYRRVATYVADWQDEENVGSKDRAPGLGTMAIEPPDWSTRFCEVKDTGLRDWVLQVFVDPNSGLLPW